MINCDNNELSVLFDGAETFPAILSCIENAEKTIEISMFIWRNDCIGRKIARALLAAADRGVKVRIRKDRCGCLYEYAEESQSSFLHDRLRFSERIAVRFMEAWYHNNLLGGETSGAPLELRDAFLSHRNIAVESSRYLFDHSKVFIFDEQTLFFGGINIEDKENGTDLEGRVWKDFTVRVVGKEPVAAFCKCRSSLTAPKDRNFIFNVKEPIRKFELKECMLGIIRGAEKELTVLMGYFAAIPAFMDAIKASAARGVKVRILIPEKANFTQDRNIMAVSRLFAFSLKSGTDIRIFLSGAMTHTKLIYSESTITVGSCNIVPRSFYQLGEANYIGPNDKSPFASRLIEGAEAIIRDSREIKDVGELRYNRFRGMFENAFL